MLFPYTYVPHQMDRMQEFIDHIFYEVWCYAPENPEFSPDLLVGNSDLQEVVVAFSYSDTKGAYFFNSHIERIHGMFAGLTEAEIEQFRQWYRANNSLKQVCANDPQLQLVRYEDLKANYKDLTEQLAAFFKGLYSQQLLNLEALKNKIGEIDDHYKEFIKVNKAGKCPFCGIADMKGPNQPRREAYDHYLPKALYPFNSINFKNLVPACNSCNSSYKTSKDPAYTPKDPCHPRQRRKVFYPYADSAPQIEISVNLRSSDIDNLSGDDLDVSFANDDYSEEIETWKYVYGVEARYKDKCCGENDGKYWLEQVLDEWGEEDGRSPVQYMNDLAKRAQKRPFADDNFLRKPFLDACVRIGLLTDNHKDSSGHSAEQGDASACSSEQLCLDL